MMSPRMRRRSLKNVSEHLFPAPQRKRIAQRSSSNAATGRGHFQAVWVGLRLRRIAATKHAHSKFSRG